MSYSVHHTSICLSDKYINGSLFYFQSPGIWMGWVLKCQAANPYRIPPPLVTLPSPRPSSHTHIHQIRTRLQSLRFPNSSPLDYRYISRSSFMINELRSVGEFPSQTTESQGCNDERDCQLTGSNLGHASPATTCCCNKGSPVQIHVSLLPNDYV